jgi:hypothetical protein
VAILLPPRLPVQICHAVMKARRALMVAKSLKLYRGGDFPPELALVRALPISYCKRDAARV